MSAPPKIFVSYSHRDKKWLKRLRVHFKALERDGAVDLWDDTEIKAGADWDEEIEQALKEAKAAILLISADFLASDYIVKEELQTLLEQAEEEGHLILQVILRPCILGKLSRFQTVNNPSEPLEGMTRVEQEEVFVRLVQTIKEQLVLEPAAPPSPQPSPNRLLCIQVDKTDEPAWSPRSYVLGEEHITMGRSSTNVLPLPDSKRIVSKRHAEIARKDDRVYLTDRSSRNFTYLNDEQLEPEQPYEIQPGDTIQIGKFEILFEALKAAPPPPSDLDFTAFGSGFTNPFLADIGHLMKALVNIGEHYDREAPSRRNVALQEALQVALENQKSHPANTLIARMLRLRDAQS